MLFILVMAAGLLLAARLSDRYKKNILETAAVAGAAILMVLYVLAFFKGLRFAGAAALVYFGYVAADLFYKKNFGKAMDYVKLILAPEMVLFTLTVVFVGVMTRDRIFTWWDDINYWSSDAKQLFYMGGFPGRYGNVSPEFGDYPPIPSLSKWLFLQISPNVYRESLQFAGYFALNGIFLLPLAGRAKEASKKLGAGAGLVVSVLMFLILMLFAGVFNGMIYYGTPSDITMGIVYGALLLAIFDREDTEPVYYYLRISLYTMVLLLTKSVGFEWAVFALIFFLIVIGKNRGILAAFIASAAAYGSWLSLCLINRRIAKLTGAGIKMATSGTYQAPDNAIDKMKYFAQGFFLMPMHGDRNPTLDISTGLAVALIFAAIVVLGVRQYLRGKEMKKILIFSAITGLLAYGIVFLAHISIFSTEDQYLDAYAMSLSIARYCAPFTLGTAYLIFGISFDRAKEKGTRGIMAVAGIWAVLVLLTADYSGIYGYLSGYRKTLEEDRQYVYDMVTDEGWAVVTAVGDSSLWGKRVLVLRSFDTGSYVHNAYISKEASPVALVHDVFTPEDNVSSIIRKMKESHAEYFYVTDPEGVADELFNELVPGGEYTAEKVFSLSGVIN